MREIKLFNTIQYLRGVDFYHDTFDLEDEGIEKVLMDYGIFDEFSKTELAEIEKDLSKMAEINRLCEARRFQDEMFGEMI